MTHVAVRVRDGIVHPDVYRDETRTPLRLLWILKEFNDSDQTWTELVGCLAGFAKSGIPRPWMSTFRKVARTSYGLLHPEDDWNRWAGDRLTYASALAHIAVINVKKQAGGRRADWKELKRAFSADEAKLRSQIAEIRPTVILCGGTLWLFESWFESSSVGYPPRFGAARLHGALWVNAYHPAYTHVTDLDYYHRISEAVRNSGV